LNNRNFIIITIVLLITLSIGFASYLPTRFEKQNKVMMSNFPKTIGNWVSEEIPISENDYAILETRNLFMRRYTDPKGESIIFYIIYSENNRKVVHPPELCLTGGGQSIEDRDSVQIGNIRAVKLMMEKGDFKQMVIYWFKAGNLNTDRYVKQQLKVVFDLLRGKKTSSALIRITTDIKNNDSQAASNLLKGFVLQISDLLPKYVP